MMTRGLSWDYQMVAAMNVIDIVFSDSPKVVEQWGNYYKTLCSNNVDGYELKKREEEKTKLLEEMAKALGYKNIDWTILQNPYIPNGMIDSMNLEWNLKNNQNILWGILAKVMQGGTTDNSQQTGNDNRNGVDNNG